MKKLNIPSCLLLALLLSYLGPALAISKNIGLTFSHNLIETISVADLVLSDAGDDSYTGTLSIVFSSNLHTGYHISIQGEHGKMKNTSNSNFIAEYKLLCGSHTSGSSTIAGADINGSSSSQTISRNFTPTGTTSATITCTVTADSSAIAGTYKENLTFKIETN